MRFAVIIAVVLLCPAAFTVTIHVPNDHATIQAAIDVAVNGDIIIVDSGTYVENIDFSGKAITVESTNGPEVTVIDGGHQDTVVVFLNQEGVDSVLQGFTVTNGYANRGGGVLCGKDSSPRIAGNIFSNNVCVKSGGGISCTACSPLIMDNIISHNTCETNYAGAGIATRSYASPTITGNIISDNSPNGILCMNNLPPSGPPSVITMTNNIITRNTCTWYGGGIQCFNSCGMIKNNTINDNSAGVYGGGIYLWQNKTSVINNDISNNRSGKSGGGISCRGVTQVPLIIAGNTIWGNTAAKMGGGISTQHGIEAIIANNLIFGNIAHSNGGGIFSGSTEPIITGNSIIGNTAREDGGGISSRYYAYPTVTNTILWNNYSPTGQVCLGKETTPSGLKISYSNLEGGQSSIKIVAGSILNWGSGMIDADPFFVNATINDCHLTHDSPCKNAGLNSAIEELLDYEGDPRIVDGTVDIGADEFYTHLYYTGDATPNSGIDMNFVGTPMQIATLYIGTDVLQSPQQTQYGNWFLLSPIFTLDLGPIPLNGVLTTRSRIPPDCPTPLSIPLQGLIDGQLTNLCTIEVQ